MKLVNYLFLTIIVFAIIFSSFSAFSKTNRTVIKRRKTFEGLVFTTNTSVSNPENGKSMHLCRWLRGLKHQSKLCNKRKGLPEILLKAKHLALSSCIDEFRYEQWNCLNTKRYFKKVYRETAIMHAISSASIVYSIAKACAAGKLENCSCGVHGKTKLLPTWKWGGCGDNSRYGKKFAYKFLQLKKLGDNPSNVLKYNSRLGVEVAIANDSIECKCHGLSHSCTMRTCYRRIRPFKEITSLLKNHYYHEAAQIEASNSINQFYANKKQKLVYLENSPNFCPSTTGRFCLNRENCATLCCGRGFNTMIKKKTVKCKCKMQSMTEVNCSKCSMDEMFFYCK